MKTMLLGMALALSLNSLNPLGAQTCPTSIGDDGFHSVNCCDIATPNLPVFPAVSLEGSYFCIKDCQTVTPFPVKISIGAPTADPNGGCDQFLATLGVGPLSPGTQPTIVTPTLLPLALKYSRTWIETDSLGNRRQIWRFIVNGQLQFAATDTQPCPQPPCTNVIGLNNLPIGDPWFHGIIEYASEIIPENGGGNGGGGGGGMGDPSDNDGSCVAAIVLSHLPGCLAHFAAPNFNFQALGAGVAAAHDDYSYHLVGPAPFTASPNVATLPPIAQISAAPITFDAVRSNSSIQMPVCRVEWPLSVGTTLTAAAIMGPNPNCLCPPVAPGGLPLYYHQDLVGAIGCMPFPGFLSVPGLSAATPSGFVQMFIGQWNLPAGQWPENRKIWSTVGIVTFDETGVCTPTPLQPAAHFTIGATTVYDSGGASISLFNGGTTEFRVMNDHANTVTLAGMPPTSEQQYVGTNLLSALVFQISF